MTKFSGWLRHWLLVNLPTEKHDIMLRNHYTNFFLIYSVASSMQLCFRLHSRNGNIANLN